MSAVLSVSLDHCAKIWNCSIYSSALPVCLRVQSFAHAFPGMLEIRNAFSSACLHATQVPRFMFLFASVFCVMKDSFQAWAGPLFIKDRVKTIFLLSLLYTSWLRVRYRVTSWSKGPALLCSPENYLRRLILISLGFGTFWFWFCLATAAAILSSWYLLFRVCRDSTELSVWSVWYSSSSVSLSGVRGLNLFRDVILSEGSWFGCLVLFFHSSMLLSVLTSCNKGAQGFPHSCTVLFCSDFWAAGSSVQGGHQYHER